MRTFQPGDEPGLARVYDAASLRTETVEKVRARMLRHPCFAPERILVIHHGEELVGTAAAWRSDREPDAGYLHMLGVMPHHRGKGLGAALVIGTLQYTRSEKLNAQRLLTDDWRLPAIRLYLELGYDPLWTDCSHPRRWRKIARAIRQPEIIGRARRASV